MEIVELLTDGNEGTWAVNEIVSEPASPQKLCDSPVVVLCDNFKLPPVHACPEFNGFEKPNIMLPIRLLVVLALLRHCNGSSLKQLQLHVRSELVMQDLIGTTYVSVMCLLCVDFKLFENVLTRPTLRLSLCSLTKLAS